MNDDCHACTTRRLVAHLEAEHPADLGAWAGSLHRLADWIGQTQATRAAEDAETAAAAERFILAQRQPTIPNRRDVIMAFEALMPPGSLPKRYGRTYSWLIPSPTGGTILIELVANPKWSRLAVDRWRTTDRIPDLAGPWLKAHVWPRVRANPYPGGTVLPVGNPTFTAVGPIRNDHLLAVAPEWIALELGEWCAPRREVTA